MRGQGSSYRTNCKSNDKPITAASTDPSSSYFGIDVVIASASATARPAVNPLVLVISPCPLPGQCLHDAVFGGRRLLCCRCVALNYFTIPILYSMKKEVAVNHRFCMKALALLVVFGVGCGISIFSPGNWLGGVFMCILDRNRVIYIVAVLQVRGRSMGLFVHVKKGCPCRCLEGFASGANPESQFWSHCDSLLPFFFGSSICLHRTKLTW